MNNRQITYTRPPRPDGKLFTGHLKEFQRDPLLFFTKLAENYGEISQFRFGPFQKVYLVKSPDLIKEILVTKQRSFVKSKDIQMLKAVVGEGLLTSEKEFHLRQRRLLQPSFNRSHIERYANDMISTTNQYIQDWKDGQERQMSDDLLNITLGIISKTMFSMDFEKGATIIGKPMESVMKLGIKRMRSIFPLPLWVPTKTNRELRKAVAALDDVIYDIIDKRRATYNAQDDLLGVLMAAQDETDGLSMSNQQLRDELMTVFLAGHETTANALTWTFYLLSKHPEVETKLYDELQKVIGESELTPQHFPLLKYTQNIISESLRLYPPAYVIGRQVDEDVIIGRYPLKKGEMVLISQYVMHRHPRYFPEPESFMPERFENNLIKTLPPFVYFPFGGGPRVCIGNHFAMMEMTLVLACIAKQFKTTLTKEHHLVKPQPLITLRPKHGIRVTVEKR